MSLHVKTTTRELEIHAGETWPYLAFGEKIEEVQADGDELELIRQYLIMPVPPSLRVVRWFGDTAQYIFYNLGNALNQKR